MAEAPGGAAGLPAADGDLIARLEAHVVCELRDWAELAERLYPGSGAECTPVGTGAVLYGGDAISFSKAAGFALDGRVTSAEVETIRAAWSGRPPGHYEIALVARGDSAAAAEFLAGGWRVHEFEDVLVLPLGQPADRPTAQPHVAGVRVAGADERESWADLVARAFADGHPEEAERRFARIVAARQTATMLWSHADGVPVATGELVVRQGLAWLSADATLPRYRGRGHQRALQAERVRLAREAGCDLAVTEAIPGGASHRNAVRAGFRRAYTRLLLTKA